MAATEHFVEVDGLKIRYFDDGEGSPALLLHGASLGSSADVWEQTLPELAARGFRSIAYDQPGFGLSDNPADYSVAYRRRFIIRLMDALGIQKAHLVGHSQAGNMAVGLAFEHPDRVSKIVALGTGSLLPPMPGGREGGPAEGEEGKSSEPTLEDTRALLEDNLYHHSLITPEALKKRHRMSIGKNFQAFLERHRSAAQGPGSGKAGLPLWQRLDQVPVPLLLIYGRNDRGSAAERAVLAKERHPGLNLHLFDHCRHLVQWDAAAEFLSLTANFLAR